MPRPRCRLTSDQVVTIFMIKLNHSNARVSKLAKLFNVSQKTIRDIWNARTWARETQHLDPWRHLPKIARRNATIDDLLHRNGIPFSDPFAGDWNQEFF